MHSALFVSAGGYHHHLGLNIWEGVGAPPPPPGSTGLRYYTILLPDAESLEWTLDRLKASGEIITESTDGFWTKDPAQNHILLRT
jgi:catechol 2,3-dioxygenase